MNSMETPLGRITSISNEDTTFNYTDKHGHERNFLGFTMTVFSMKTGTSILMFGVENEAQCCEAYGYITSEDDISDFIGSTLYAVKVVDTSLSTVNVPEDLYEGDAMFVNLETSNGTLQFVVFNEHNGNYGHEAVLVTIGSLPFSENSTKYTTDPAVLTKYL